MSTLKPTYEDNTQYHLIYINQLFINIYNWTVEIFNDAISIDLKVFQSTNLLQDTILLPLPLNKDEY